MNGQCFGFALLDTGMGIQNIFAAIKPLVREHVSVFNTHWHFDHAAGNQVVTCYLGTMAPTASSTIWCSNWPTDP